MSTRDFISSENGTVDFSKIKVGIKALEDAVVSLGDFKKINPTLADKTYIQKAIDANDVDTLREVSDFFFRVSGIYSRLCKHLSNFYRYDWVLTPHIYTDGKVDNQKVIASFNSGLEYLDEFQVKRFFGETALKVIRHGCYYGYLIYNEGSKKVAVQELPVKYCRSRFTLNGRPAVEFNMKFFDDYYKDPQYRYRILNNFPADFKKGYLAFREKRLVPDYPGDTAGWYLLDPEFAFKFNIGGEDYPPFISVIPHLIDLDAAQELDRKKMAQKLLKIIIQKMPIDKNGDLIFDVDEAQALHNNAVRMLGKAIGIDVLTTFAETSVADLADKSSVSSIDELEKVERTVYNESGTAQNLFNTDGNIALEKSILDDEASLYGLIQQFQDFLNIIIRPLNKKNKKWQLKATILPTTIYNYKDMAKLYKEQVQLGYSKMYPQVALGHSQSSILATAKFENEILELVNIFTPPMSSNTMNADSLKKNQENKKGEEKKAGRTEKPDDEKSEKTIKNRESMS